MKRIDTIKEKLSELKNLDKGFSIFGAARHKYQFNPTLNKKEIEALEAEYQISLSDEYQEILMHLGNGGAGCGYGLEKLSLKHIHPPYIGTKQLLRNWDDPTQIEIEMIDSDEISGYIRLFNYGCGMEYCLLVNSDEKGSIIYFDSDERFEKLKDPSILDMYDRWLDYNLEILKRVQQKLSEMPLQEVVDSEWAIDNHFVKDMILSLIDANPIQGGHSGREVNIHLAKEYKKWKANN